MGCDWVRLGNCPRDYFGGITLNGVQIAGIFLIVFGVGLATANIAFAQQIHLALTPPSGTYFDHVVIIMMENEGLQNICGGNPPPCLTSAAPNLAGLANTYTVAQQYSSVFTPLTSFPNYIGMVAGSTFNCNGGGCSGTLAQKSIVDSLESAGLSWKAYQENMPLSSGCSTFTQEPYSNIHNPFIWFNNIVNSTTRCNKIVNANPANCAMGPTGFPTDCNLINDLNSANPPNYAWLTPNDCNNMHGVTGGCPASITTGDNYIGNLVPQILASSAFVNTRSVIFLTFDEGTGYCPINGGSLDCLYASWIGSPARKGYVFTNSIFSHYSALATIESNWNLPRLQAGDTSAVAMTAGLVTGPNPETAIVSVAPSNALVGQTVSWSITISNAPIGQTQSVGINYGDGSSANLGLFTPSTGTISTFSTHSFSTPGSYSAVVTVTQGSTIVLAQPVQGVTVTNPVPTMTVSFTFSPAQPQVGTSVLFNGTATCGSCVQPYTYFWQFGDNASDYGQLVIHTYSKYGAFPVVLAVCDNGLPTCGSASKTLNIPTPTCVTTNTCITVSFTWLPLQPVSGQLINFAVQIQGGTQPYTVTWTFGDGYTISGTQPSHVYAGTGTFLVTVTITDSGGNTGKAQDSVTVQATPPCMGSQCSQNPFLQFLSALGTLFLAYPLVFFGGTLIISGVFVTALPVKAKKP